MNNREPFWWPMNEPPLPEPVEWSGHIAAERAAAGVLIRLGTFSEMLEVDPSVTEHAANLARLRERLRP